MNRTLRLGVVAIATAAIFAASGCLGSSHHIPRSELLKLSSTAPEQRGERVRVIQGFAGDDQPPEAPHVHAHTTVIVTSHGGGGSVGGRAAKSSAKAASEDSKYWLVLAALAAVVLAATEGARYDGWVKLHPMHPVHLYGPYGEYTWVPLAQLDQKTAAWATKAFVRPSEGPWEELGRAPLHRTGFTYALLLGSGEIPSAREQGAGDSDPANSGFLGHIQLGVFPNQTTGILLDFGMGWRENAFNETVFEARNALELQLFPVQAGAFHAGGYAQAGIAVRLEDGTKSSERRSFVGGVGALVQLDVTTRLALMARMGYLRILGEDTAEATVGVAIY